MNHSKKKGFSFGLASGVITTLGLMVGLHSSTHSTSVVIGGILVIAIADALSDAMGIHLSDEASKKHSEKEVWESTISTFLSKFFVALTFVVPVLFLPLSLAIFVSIVWGLGLISLFSFYIAIEKKEKPLGIILEHLLITCLVIFVTHFIGDFASKLG